MASSVKDQPNHDEKEPLHPPLHLCSLIDSRFSSRQKIRNQLLATGLFEQLVEPESLADAIDVFKLRAVDTCVIGPSVTDKGSGRFVEKARELKESTSCGFLRIEKNGRLRPADDSMAGDKNSATDPDESLQEPVSARTLYDGVANAVRRACRDDEKLSRLSAHEAQVELPVPLEVHNETTKISSMEELAGTRSASVTENILTSFVEGELDFRGLMRLTLRRELTESELNNLDENTLESIRTLLTEVLRVRRGSSRVKFFYNYLIDCIQDWLGELESSKVELATSNLREKILAFKSSS